MESSHTLWKHQLCPGSISGFCVDQFLTLINTDLSGSVCFPLASIACIIHTMPSYFSDGMSMITGMMFGWTTGGGRNLLGSLAPLWMPAKPEAVAVEVVLGAWKASLTAHVKATTLAAIYQSESLSSFGCPSNSNAMCVWIEGSRPHRNFMTMASPSMYSAFLMSSSNSSMYSSTKCLPW